jgi:hypothetical protein
MKVVNTLLLFICFAVMAPIASCAPAHYVKLSWTPSTESGATTNLWRAGGACPATGLPTGATEITTGLTGNTYTDNTVAVGSYCYYATATVSGIESYPSKNAQADVKPFGPTSLAITATQ